MPVVVQKWSKAGCAAGGVGSGSRKRKMCVRERKICRRAEVEMIDRFEFEIEIEFRRCLNPRSEIALSI